jgi:hypothetical protein
MRRDSDPAEQLARRAAFALAAVLGLAGAADTVGAQPAGEAKTRAAASHGAGHVRAVASRPALASGVAFAPDGRLWLVGLDARGQLAVRASDDDGGSWGPERVLDTGADRIVAASQNRPQIAFGPDGRVAISYAFEYAKPAKHHAGEVRLLRSADGGRTFAAPVTVHRDRQAIAHAFASIAFETKGALHTVWIDKRDAEAAAARAEPGYVGSAVYRNVSADGGRTFGPDTRVADHACECCRIALAPAPGGGLAVLWRHVFGANVRDHAFAIIGEAADRAPVRATFDDWRIDACPHHGPGLAPAEGGGYHAVWFGSRGGRSAVRYGRLDADGRPQGEVRELPDEAAEHADVESAGRHVVVAWRTYDGRATALRAWISPDGGATFAARTLATSADPNDLPRLARKGERIFVVWRTAKEVKVERVVP